MCFDLSNNPASFVKQFRWKVRPKRKFQASFCVYCRNFCNFAACETSLKERFTLLSNKNPPERERFQGVILNLQNIFLPIILFNNYSANRPYDLTVGFVHYRRIQ